MNARIWKNILKKVKVTFDSLEFCLRLQLCAFKEFCMETRLFNIFKTTNITNLTKVSISYIQMKNTKTTRLLFKGNWILTYFWHSRWHYFGYISGKVAKPHFLESPQESLKIRKIHIIQIHQEITATCLSC